MTTATCPSCGAPVPFRGAASIVAVCAFCRSMLVREGAKLENVGRQAALIEDASPIQLGTQGRYRGRHFIVVGRIQYAYGAGVWNEWHLLYDDQRSGWLSDASGEYLVTSVRSASGLPAAGELSIGERLRIAGEEYEVANVERATVVAGEGELPFRFEGGWEGAFADLRGEEARFATIDYSEEPPRLYLGESVAFESLSLSGLREDRVPTAKAQAFNCPSCGSPLERKVAASESVGCASCGAVIDVTNAKYRIISRVEEHRARVKPTIPLGSRGTLQGAEYEAIGFMRREMRVDGVPYAWGEYLLHNPERGYLWLSEYQGHFSVVKTAANVPKVRSGSHPVAHYLGRPFKHFQTYTAKVIDVLGEFNWRVEVGETAKVEDYVSPPLILSREATSTERTWSLGEYIEPEALWTALRLQGKPPRRVGVAPNQPSPHSGRVWPYWKWFAIFAVAALVLQLGFRLLSDTRVLYKQLFEVVPGRLDADYESPPFEVPGTRPVALTVRSQAAVNNSWVYLEMQLIDQDTGRAYRLGREVSYYHGVADGESWSEGTSNDGARIADVPPGRYVLAIEAEGGDSRAPIRGTVEIFKEAPGWLNLVLALLALALVPAIVTWRASGFEKRRWAESDYGPTDDEDDE